MEVKVFCPFWGSEDLNFDFFCKKVKNEGYTGIEMAFHTFNTKSKKSKVLEILNNYDLQLVAQHWETNDKDFNQHKNNYYERLSFLTDTNPIFINSQTGKDYFSMEQNLEIISIASEITNRTGVKIVHETHRGKFSYASHVTCEYLKQNPAIRLTADFSHWCNVSETFLEDQTEFMSLAIEHSDYIHARVGHPQGAQVSDPRAPEWKDALDRHFYWWNQIIERNKNEGKEIFYITPEFGPFPYMPSIPFSQQPVANQWEVNAFMKNEIFKRVQN